MGDKKIVVTDYGFPDLRQEREILEPMGFQLVTGQCQTAEEVIHLAQDADAILCQWAPLTSDVIQHLTRCQVIVRYGIGVDNVDLKAAEQRNIPVVNVPDYAVNEVADHAFSLLLSIVRKISLIALRVKKGVWEITPCPPIMGLQQKKLGLAGFGNIAQAVAKRAQAFGLEIMAYDPFVEKSAFKDLEVERVNWESLITQSDILSVHLPLTESTKHIFRTGTFHRMKENAFIVNTSRGGVICTEDLVEALQNHWIAGAALDVLEDEPIDSKHPLLSMDQCLVTSHCAWYSEESLQRLQRYAALELKRHFNGEKLKHIVNQVQV